MEALRGIELVDWDFFVFFTGALSDLSHGHMSLSYHYRFDIACIVPTAASPPFSLKRESLFLFCSGGQDGRKERLHGVRA